MSIDREMKNSWETSTEDAGWLNEIQRKGGFQGKDTRDSKIHLIQTPKKPQQDGSVIV